MDKNLEKHQVQPSEAVEYFMLRHAEFCAEIGRRGALPRRALNDMAVNICGACGIEEPPSHSND